MGEPLKKPRLLFYCQHVLGIGHLIRSAEVVRGLDAFDVTFLNGGQTVEGFELPPAVRVVKLPPIESDAEFRNIYAADGCVSVEAIKDRRRSVILDTWASTQPDTVVIELFPFGRKKFAFELLPLLERIRKDGRRTKVVCSLRDILVGKRDQARWEDRVCELVNEYFDLILVHSDPALQRLEETFGRAFDLRCRIEYTGFVTPSEPVSDEAVALPEDGKPVVLASIGGGRVGSELLEAAIRASRLVQDECPHRLCVVGGPYIADADWTRIRALANAHACATLVRYTTRFTGYLRRSALSISMSGYNTCMNILTARVPALVLPFEGNGNDEQSIRARKLDEAGVLSVLKRAELEPVSLGARIVQQLTGRRVGAVRPLDTSGVATTARILEELAGIQAEVLA